jgi:hypothetical protein
MSNQATTNSGHRWLILSFTLPCLIVGLAAVGILIWDMWGSSEPADIALGALQSFLFFGIPSGLAGSIRSVLVDSLANALFPSVLIDLKHGPNDVFRRLDCKT